MEWNEYFCLREHVLKCGKEHALQFAQQHTSNSHSVHFYRAKWKIPLQCARR